MHDRQLVLAARLRLRGLVCIVVLAVTCLAIPAGADECRHEHPDVEIRLPEGEDFVEAVTHFRLDREACPQYWTDDGGFDFSMMWTQSFPEIKFKGSGGGLFEAKVVLTEQQAQLFRPVLTDVLDLIPLNNIKPDLPIALLGGGAPDSFDATQRKWLYTRPFSDELKTSVEVGGPVWQSETDLGGEVLQLLVTREFELRLSIRRIPNRCYMHASVSGGRGSGEYFGDIAYFGNPTGLGSETVAGLEGMLEWAQTLKASMGTEEGDDIESESEGEESPSPLSGLADAMEGIKSLTLQDVKLGDGGGTGSLGGFGEMVGAFNLTAHDVTVSEPIDGETIFSGKRVGTATHLGLKAPGLAIANMRICDAPPPVVTFRKCPGEQELNMEQSPYCGGLLGKVCHEAGHTLTVDADFIAGDSIADCIH